MKRIFRFLLAWTVPTCVFFLFYYQATIPFPQTIPFQKLQNRSDDSFDLVLPTDEKFYELKQHKELASDSLLKLLQIPETLGEYEYCILHKSFAINSNEEVVPSDDFLILTFSSGSQMTIPPEKPQCFKKKPDAKIVGFLINHEQSIQYTNEWGLKDNTANTSTLNGYAEIRYEIRFKKEIIFIVFPLVVTSLWWGILLLYSQVEEKFIYFEITAKTVKRKSH